MHNYWLNKNVFITGATGLVGSWLVRDLVDRGAKTTVLIRDTDPQSELIRSSMIKRTTVVNGCLEEISTLERAITENEVDTVFHLGAQTIVGTAYRNPLGTFEANIRGTYNLLEACRRQSSTVKRVVIASSDKAYGSSPVLPYTEDMPLNGEHPYDVSKSCTDLISYTYYNTYNLPVAIARCGNIYGGGDLNWSRIIPGTIRSYHMKEAPVIRSNGLFTRDYIYVLDVVNAYRVLAEQLHREEVKGQSFNFGPNRPYNVLEIVDEIRTLMECHGIQPQILNQAVAEIKDQTLCSEKARRILNWNPSYSLQQGLSETISWYESNIFNKEMIHV